MKWPFDQPENCGVLTKRQILEDGLPILFVSHDLDDDGWQFLDGADEHDTSDGRIVCLSHVVDMDPSLLALADLPPGWVAWRKTRTSAWLREENTNHDE